MTENETHSSTPALPSNQNFGWVFTTVFVLGGAYSAWKHYSTWATGLFVLAVLFAAVTLVAPKALAPLNRLWFKFGLLLGRIVSPIVLGIIFFLLITPVALGMRIFGRDELALKKRQATSYWINREPKGPSPESFKNQF